MKIAAIDFGTNSTRLLIADCTDHNGMVSVKPVERKTSITQLGSTLHSSRLIEHESIEKTKQCLETYAGLISKHKVTAVYSVATSVFRDALNSIQVKTDFEHIIGSPITLLSGEEEARLMYAGITANRSIDKNAPVLCLDIGGGSCELVYAVGNKIYTEMSLPIGCLRTKKQFWKSEPPSMEDIDRFMNHIKNTIPDTLIDTAGNSHLFFAFGGTVTSLGLICKKLDVNHIDKLEGAILHRSEIQIFLDDITTLTEQDIAGKYANYLDNGRETVIRSGSIIFAAIMDILGKPQAVITNQGILSGVIITQYNTLKNHLKR
ncbi:MAG: hypothetical protein RBU23_07230 [Candidatus Auribacterota bacterium]|jgi:exopolyphosphatase/guanosine-5'-triphosphate,3'-diphosphate pyrophosphatase|nr:hypothetical protein [Candidatus Auribacterota bacterium]